MTHDSTHDSPHPCNLVLCDVLWWRDLDAALVAIDYKTFLIHLPRRVSQLHDKRLVVALPLDPQGQTAPKLAAGPPHHVVALLILVESKNDNAVKLGLNAVDRPHHVRPRKHHTVTGRRHLVSRNRPA